MMSLEEKTTSLSSWVSSQTLGLQVGRKGRRVCAGLVPRLAQEGPEAHPRGAKFPSENFLRTRFSYLEKLEHTLAWARWFGGRAEWWQVVRKQMTLWAATCKENALHRSTNLGSTKYPSKDSPMQTPNPQRYLHPQTSFLQMETSCWKAACHLQRARILPALSQLDDMQGGAQRCALAANAPLGGHAKCGPHARGGRCEVAAHAIGPQNSARGRPCSHPLPRPGAVRPAHPIPRPHLPRRMQGGRLC